MPYDQSVIDLIHSEVDNYIKSKRAFPPIIQVSNYQQHHIKMYESEVGSLTHDFNGGPKRVYTRCQLVSTHRPRR